MAGTGAGTGDPRAGSGIATESKCGAEVHPTTQRSQQAAKGSCTGWSEWCPAGPWCSIAIPAGISAMPRACRSVIARGPTSRLNATTAEATLLSERDQRDGANDVP